MRRWTLAITMILALAACGDPAAETDDGPGPQDGLATDTPRDEGVPPADDGVDVQPDVPVPPDEGPEDFGPGNDLQPDKTPPTATCNPPDEATEVAIPFTVKVIFNEAIRAKETIDSNTLRLVDVNGIDVVATRVYDEATFTVTLTPDPKAVLLPAAPYTVMMSNLIQDLAGNRMVPATCSFATAQWGNQQVYRDLAIKYSPILNQSVDKVAPQFDYITSFDFDGNWKAADNDKNAVKATEIPAWVHYDVVETKSHWYVRYAWFYPRHNESTNVYGNEVAGVTIVVRKYPEAPIAAMTYFGAEAKEDVRVFVTAESGLVQDRDDPPDGNLNDDRKFYGVNWVFPQSQLFPAGHFQAYLTASTHESCAWAQENKEVTTDFRCVLNAGIKKTLSIVQYAYVDGVAGKLTKGAGGFPTFTPDGQPVGYGLKSVMGEWWVRRDRTGDDRVFSATFNYEPEDGRGGNGLLLPTSFTNTERVIQGDPDLWKSEPGGRPPWAWNWNPSVPDPDFYQIQFWKGALYLDPAYFVAKRHRVPLGWNAKDHVGFSDVYCFNPYLLIDQRDKDPDCKVAP